MPLLYANPYDISAVGFFFEDAEEYEQKCAVCRNAFGFEVEEFEIDFIHGEDIDFDLFKALDVHQGNFESYLDACDEWHDEAKRRVIIAVGECGTPFDLATDDPESLEIDIYEMESLRDLADFFLDEGLFGEIPIAIRHYIDLSRVARDLSVEYSEIRIAGEGYVYRCV